MWIYNYNYLIHDDGQSTGGKAVFRKSLENRAAMNKKRSDELKNKIASYDNAARQYIKFYNDAVEKAHRWSVTKKMNKTSPVDETQWYGDKENAEKAIKLAKAYYNNHLLQYRGESFLAQTRFHSKVINPRSMTDADFERASLIDI